MLVDTAVRGGRVFVGNTWLDADIFIDGQRIAGIVDRSQSRRGWTARLEIEASGLHVFPGAIDTHTHTRDPGYTHKEDFKTASEAAAAGGITTMIDMPNVEPPTDTVEEFTKKRQRAATMCVIDWGHWAAGTKPEHIPKLAEAGVTGFKIFQVSGNYPHDPRLAINDEESLVASFRAIAATGLPVLVHPFNQSLFDRLSSEAFAAGKAPDGKTFSEVYVTEEIWHTAVSVLIALQRLTSVRLHLLHTHSAGSLNLIREAKARGQKVTCEIDPKYYHITLDDLDRLGGMAVPGGFVCADRTRMAEIERSLIDGTIDNVATDHAPHLKEEVARANVDAWSANLGSPQLEWLFALLLTDVSDGKLPLNRVPVLLAEGPARVVGVWPRKGAILPGSDADLALVDLDEAWTVTNDGIRSRCGWSPYVGRTLRGRVKMTLSRGEVVMRDGEVVGQPGHGKYVAGVAR